MKIKSIETITKSEAKKAVRYFEKKHPGSEVIASGWATHPQTEDDKVTGFQTVSVELWNEEERESYTVYLAVCLWDRRHTFVMKDAENWYTEPAKEETANNNTENEEGESQKGQNTMKQYYITSNVNDRNATAKNLANGEKFDVWFTSGTVRHYDEQGDLISAEAGTMNWDEVERIDPTKDKTMYVGFNFGSYVYLTVSIHEGLTLDECVCLRGQGDIDTYKNDSGEWVKCAADFDATLEKLRALRERPDETETNESTEGGKESAPAFTIAHNDEYNGTEVSFPGKPSEEVRSTLKALGFRWHSKRRVWYGRKDAGEVRAALVAVSGCAEEEPQEPKQNRKPVKGTTQDHIRIYWNGIKVDGGKLVRCFYSLDNNADHAPSVSISARDYDHLPRDLFEVRNETDIYTDYFDSDYAYLTPEHPLYKYFRYAAAKAKIRDLKAKITRYGKELDGVERWPGRFEHVREYLATDEAKLAELEAMTDPGQPTAEDLAEIDRQRQEAENARKAAEHEAELREREIYLAQRVNGQRLIKAEQDAHPIKAGEPVVCINWSEHPAFEAYADDELVLSLTAADNILRELDHEQHETRESDSGRGWYFKTKFTITGTGADGELFTYTGRYDLGDGDGGLMKHILSFGEYYRTHDNFGHEIENPPETTDTIDFADFLAGHVEAVEAREIIDPDGIHKHTITKSGTAYIVTFFEMMGGRWVPLSSPERWSPELVQELVEA